MDMNAARPIPAHISASGLSLDVPIFLQHERNSRAWFSLMLGAAFDRPKRKIQNVLSDVSFELRSGERLAVFGRNGAGKSSLLRLLNGAYLPTRGRMEIRGSRQSLLNISLGFNPEATLKENIFLRGSAMGLTSQTLATHMEDILEFAGVAEKANHRLKTLSSGQVMRLGFSISTSVQHDIMLMDEWVGTGDAEFIEKAKRRLLGRVEGSQIVVLASHNLNLARSICNKGLVLERGRVVYFGDVAGAAVEYSRLMAFDESVTGVAQAHDDETSAAKTQFTGSVEVLEFSEGRLVVKGWALADFNRVPALLRVTAGGQVYDVTEYRLFARPDVQQRYGLDFVLCGYHVEIEDLPFGSLRDMEGGFSVHAGNNAEELGGPLHMAGAVVRQIEY